MRDQASALFCTGAPMRCSMNLRKRQGKVTRAYNE
jgi:hypothetical protein